MRSSQTKTQLKLFSVTSFAVVIFLFSLQSFGVPKKNHLAKVIAHPLKVEQLHEVLFYPARVVSRVQAPALAEIDGVVTQILKPLGSSVKKGQKLLRLENTDPIYQYAPIYVRAPVSGVVSQVHVTTGSRIPKGKELLIITDPKDLKLELEIAATDLPQIQAKLAGEFRPTGQQNSFKVEVEGISPFVDPATGTAKCELRVLSSEKNQTLHPGIVGRVEFKTDPRDAITVPQHAIHYSGEKTFLRLIEDKKVKRIPVSLGKVQQGRVEVFDPNGKALSNEGAIYIERSNRFLSEGDEVEIENQESENPDSSNKTASS